MADTTPGPMAVSSPGGARAVLVPDPDDTLVAVSLRLATGSRHDPQHASGLAHVLEHLMFRRARQAGGARYTGGARQAGGGSHSHDVQAAGGYVNAKTSADWTKFIHVVPPELVAMVLDLEIERFTGAAGRFDPGDLEREKEVVLSERHQRMDGAPYGTAVERLVAALHPAPSAYHRLPIGLPEHVRAMTVDDCRRFYADHYVAGRVNVVVAGAVTPAVLDHVTRLLEAFPTGPAGTAGPVSAGQPVVPAQAELETALPRAPETIRLPASAPGRPKVYLALPLPPEGTWAFECARLAAFFLGRGMACRLGERLGRQLGLTAAVAVKTIGRAYGHSVGVIEATPADGVPPEKVVAAVETAIAEVVDGALDEHDLQRAKAVYRLGWLSDMDSIDRRSDGLSLTLQLTGSVDAYLHHDGRIAAVGLADLHDAVRLWHQPPRLVELVYS
ncbi:MAG TPA: pitrilysin family protein [Micromonosporaceae bacterium]|nr:pitrilysin family protein [Micromonosporaceae bacterium]